MIAVVDYKKGNLLSVARGLQAVGAEAVVTSDADEIARADAIVLPGVGAFTDAMQTIRELGQDEAIQEAVSRDVPFLGICLGLHLMFEAGEEHAEGNEPTPGLTLIPGVVRRMPRTNAQGTLYKIPHVGWNTVEYTDQIDRKNLAGRGSGGVHKASSARRESPSGAFAKAGLSERLSVPGPPPSDGYNPLFKGIPTASHFYFTHSYIAPESAATIATTTHSVTFPCAVQAGNAFGVQFHPEKSSDAGHQLLANFVEFVRKA